MIYTKKELTYLTISSTLLFACFFYMYKFLLDKNFGDIIVHFTHSVAISKGEKQYPPNFLLYWITNFGNTIASKKIIFITIISLSICLKYIVSYIIIKKETLIKNSHLILVMSFSLLFIFSLPSLSIYRNQFYLGNFATLTWHNSTTIFLMPFSILLYYFVFNVTPNKTTIFITTVLILLNIFIKPSFLFVLIGLLCFSVIFKTIKEKTLTRKTLLYIFYIFIICLLILVQYFFIYSMNIGSIQNEKSSIEINFLKFYTKFSIKKNIPIAFISGYLFPILLVFYKKSLSYANYLNSWILVLLSLLLMFTISETGPREFHGNFYWQIIPSSYLLFLFSTILVIKFFQKISKIPRMALITTIALHTLFGVYYLFRVIAFQEFR